MKGRVNSQEPEDLSGRPIYIGLCKGIKKHGQGVMHEKLEGEVCIGEWTDN